MQGLADGTGTGDLGLEVRLDLVGQDGLGQVAAEDGRIGQDAVQLVGDGLGLAELDAGELGLQLVLQRVSTDLKGVAVVLYKAGTILPDRNTIDSDNSSARVIVKFFAVI